MLLTIDKCGSKIARNSVFDCHLSPFGRQMAIENSVSNNILSTFVDSTIVFDCRLSSMCMLGNFSCFCSHTADFFSKSKFSKHYHSFRWFQLQPDQEQHSVGPRLAKVISRRQKVAYSKEKVKSARSATVPINTYLLLSLTNYEKVLVTGLMRTINNFHHNDSRTCKKRKYWHQLFSIIFVICWWCTMDHCGISFHDF